MRDYLYNLATDKSKGFFASVSRLFLWLLSIIYGLAVSILSLSLGFFARKVVCKVISVGNITLGGTGKTSLVEYIARYLVEKGHKVAVLSRGYKSKSVSQPGSQVIISEDMGDEPFMLQKNLSGVPVIVGKDRLRSANLAIKEYGADTVILDDAFQQWKIKKDLEIVTIDANNPFGNRQLIPRGILREPVFSLKRADILVLTKANLSSGADELKSALAEINSNAMIIESSHIPESFYDLFNPKNIFPSHHLKNKVVSLFSGIGDPGSFESLVKSLGIKVGFYARFPDHHSYQQQEIDKIVKDAKNQGADFIITTQKDAVKLCGLNNSGYGITILVMRIQLTLENETTFNSRLLKLYTD